MCNLENWNRITRRGIFVLFFLFQRTLTRQRNLYRTMVFGMTRPLLEKSDVKRYSSWFSYFTNSAVLPKDILVMFYQFRCVSTRYYIPLIRMPRECCQVPYRRYFEYLKKKFIRFSLMLFVTFTFWRSMRMCTYWVGTLMCPDIRPIFCSERYNSNIQEHFSWKLIWIQVLCLSYRLTIFQQPLSVDVQCEVKLYNGLFS